MAKKLGMELHFVYTAIFPRGMWYAPFRYVIQVIKTIFLLCRRRPQVIFIQNPPILGVFCVYTYCVLTGGRYLVDAHSDALLPKGWTTPPAWVKSFLAKRAIVTIVTNEHLKQKIEGFGGKAVIIKDIPTTFEVKDEYPLDGKFNVVVVNTFDWDEPLKEVLKAAVDLPDVQFYITGKIGSKNLDAVAGAPANVHFTDFLPDEAYYGLLNAAHAVICLTIRDNTMQRGACEALSLGKPIITSDWPILRQYFNRGTVHVDNTAEGICQGILKMKNEFSLFEIGIKELQLDQQREWEEKINILVSLLNT
jgi:glycosyltransferase involved in cell wall biosynthesis